MERQPNKPVSTFSVVADTVGVEVFFVVFVVVDVSGDSSANTHADTAHRQITTFPLKKARIFV